MTVLRDVWDGERGNIRQRWSRPTSINIYFICSSFKTHLHFFLMRAAEISALHICPSGRFIDNISFPLMKNQAFHLI